MSKMRLGVRLWRERGIKGVRVPLWGRGGSPSPCHSEAPRGIWGGASCPLPFHWGWGRRLAEASDTNPLT